MKKIFLIILVIMFLVASGCNNSTIKETQIENTKTQDTTAFNYSSLIMNDTLISYLDCFNMSRAEVENLSSGVANNDDNFYILDNISFLGKEGQAIACYGNGEMGSDYNTLYWIEVVVDFKSNEMENVKKQLETKMLTTCSIDRYENGRQYTFNIDIPETPYWIHCEDSYTREGMLLITIHSNETHTAITTDNSSSDDINTNKHTDSEAWSCAKNIVEENLKAPSTAKFCTFHDANITDLGNGKYLVMGWVEAENSYGVMLREDFTVTYTATSSGYKNAEIVFN